MPEFKYVIVDSDGKFSVRESVHSATFHDDRYYRKEEMFWMEAVATQEDLPDSGNKHGDARIVLDVQNIFVWAEEEGPDEFGNITFIGEWLPIFGRYWSAPVDTYVSLPPTDNLDGELRLVIDSATIYRWADDTSSWGPLVQPAAMAFWQAPVTDFSSLPLTGNAGGDVRVTMDSNNLWIWNGITFEWTTIEVETDVYWMAPVASAAFLPLTGNRNGEVILTKDDNGVWRWDSSTFEWVNIHQIPGWKEAVDTHGDLPVVGNTDGDIRYVKDLTDATYGNRLYRWSSLTSTWTMVLPGTHFHDSRYYTKSDLDPSASVGNNVLDDRYYTESELLGGALDTVYPTWTDFNAEFDEDVGHHHTGVTGEGPLINYETLINVPTTYWKNPVANYGALAASGNNDGDIRITLSDSNIYRYRASTAEWEIISTGIEKWKTPVASFGALPLSGNSNGDARIVLDENVLYRWDSSESEWVPITAIQWQERFALTGGQTEINLTNTYTIGNDEIMVYTNGLLGTVDEDYSETTTQKITLLGVGEVGDRVTVVGKSQQQGYQPQHTYEEYVVTAGQAAVDQIEVTSSLLPITPANTDITPEYLRSNNILVDVIVEGLELYDAEYRYHYDSGTSKKLIKMSGTGYTGYDLTISDRIKIKIMKL